MAAVFCWFSVILVLGCAVLRFMRRRTLANWMLVLFPAALCGGLWLDLAHDVAKPGQPGYHADLRALPYLLVFLLITLLAALRPKWSWLFWILWVCSALTSAILVFFTFIFG